MTARLQIVKSPTPPAETSLRQIREPFVASSPRRSSSHLRILVSGHTTRPWQTLLAKRALDRLGCGPSLVFNSSTVSGIQRTMMASGRQGGKELASEDETGGGRSAKSGIDQARRRPQRLVGNLYRRLYFLCEMSVFWRRLVPVRQGRAKSCTDLRRPRQPSSGYGYADADAVKLGDRGLGGQARHHSSGLMQQALGSDHFAGECCQRARRRNFESISEHKHDCEIIRGLAQSAR